MPIITPLSDRYHVCPQIEPHDVADIAARGYAALVCMRPDGESPGQPPWERVAAQAHRYGLAIHFIPARSGQVAPEQALQLRGLINIHHQHPVQPRGPVPGLGQQGYVEHGAGRAAGVCLPGHLGGHQRVDDVLKFLPGAGFGEHQLAHAVPGQRSVRADHVRTEAFADGGLAPAHRGVVDEAEPGTLRHRALHRLGRLLEALEFRHADALGLIVAHGLRQRARPRRLRRHRLGRAGPARQPRATVRCLVLFTDSGAADCLAPGGKGVFLDRHAIGLGALRINIAALDVDIIDQAAHFGARRHREAKVAIDLFAHRSAHVIGVREALGWSAFWVALGVAQPSEP